MRSLVVLLALCAGAFAKCPARGNGVGGTEVDILWGGDSVSDHTTQIVWSPVNIEHAFVVNQRGSVRVRSKDGTLATTVLDIEDQVYSWHDRGMTALAFHPNYENNHFIFVYYAKQPAIPWADDSCTRTGVDDARNFCGSNGVLQRFTVAPIMTAGVATGYQKAVAGPILIEDWCTSSMTHGLGNIAFLDDNSLVTTAGDGSQALGGFDTGLVYDTCFRPGGDGSRPQGSFRSQRMDFLNGKMIRVLPLSLTTKNTALILGTDYFIIAKGLRNPYRFTVHPVSGDIYIGDVGSSGLYAREEINRLKNPVGATTLQANFGWPCMEGEAARGEVQTWVAANPDVNDEGCKALWAGTDPLYRPPVFTYRDTQESTDTPMDPRKPASCATGDGAIDGMTVYQNGPLAGMLGNKLIFSDYPKKCVAYFDNIGESAVPDFDKPPHVLTEGAFFTDVKYGPDGFLYLAAWTGDVIGVLEVKSASTVVVPVASVTTEPTPADVKAGAVLTFDASGSINADNSAMTNYAWDFDGDGEIDAETAVPTVDHTYAESGVYAASVTVTNTVGTSDCVDTDVLVGINAAIEMSPAPGEWVLGDTVEFSLTVEGATVAAEDVAWGLVTKHCFPDRCTGESMCHDHADALIGTQAGITGLSFKPIAHEMPSYAELTANININGHVVARSFDTVAKTFAWGLRTVPSGFPIYSGESGIVCPYSNPPCTIGMQANNNLAVTVAGVQAIDDAIYAFDHYDVNQNDETAAVTASQVTDAATADGEVVAYFTKVEVTPSETLAAPTNFTIVAGGADLLTATWKAVEGAEYYIVYLATSTKDGLAHVPASTYPTAQAIASPETTMLLAMPDGTVDYVGSVAAYVHSKKELGPRSETVTVRTARSETTCLAGDAACAYPAGDACTGRLSATLSASGLGSFYDDRCVLSDALPGCQSGSGCRMCYWDRCAWSVANGGADPGYVPDCPPCVATAYGTEKSEQTCDFSSSDGVDPNASMATPAPTPSIAPGTPVFRVQMRSCLVGDTANNYAKGDSNGDGASDNAVLFQMLLQAKYGHATVVTATGSCDAGSFSRRRRSLQGSAGDAATVAAGGQARQLAGEAATTGAEVTYNIMELTTESDADAVAKEIIGDSGDDSTLALQLALGGLSKVNMVLTSSEYSVEGYEKDDGSSGDGGFAMIGIVAVAVVAAAAAVLVAGGLLLRKRQNKRKEQIVKKNAFVVSMSPKPATVTPATPAAATAAPAAT